MSSSTTVVVSRGSQVHQVPQTGRPQREPRASVSTQNSTPISADATATRSQRIRPVRRYATLATNTTPKDRNASQAAGTCTYISRCTSPCSASAGTTSSPRTAVATSPTRVAQPRVRWAPLVAVLTRSRSIALMTAPRRPVLSQRLQVLHQVTLLRLVQVEVEGVVVVPDERLQVGEPAVVVEAALLVGPQPLERGGA